MKKLDVTEFAEMTGKSTRHIRNLCKEGRLPCQKVSIATGEKYFIYVETDEAKEMLNAEVAKTHPSPILTDEEGTEELNVINAEFTSNASPEGNDFNAHLIQSMMEQIKESQKYLVGYNQQINELQTKVISYAELAGQAKLLTDSEHQTKQHFLAVAAENKTLIQEKAKLEERTTTLTQQLDNTQKRLKDLEEKLKQQDQSKLNNWFKRL